MKRLPVTLLFLSLLVSALPSLAQTNNDFITLNDATPAIDVVITLPPDTTGTVYVDLAQAQVTLTDANGVPVFTASDARLHALEINIAPNSGSHTLTVKRLTGVTEAYVKVTSLSEISMNGTVASVTGDTLTLNQEVSLDLSATQPGGMATVTIPDGTTGAITATFPGASADAQWVDSNGVVIATATGGHVDGLTMVIDAGNYNFTLLSSQLTKPIVAGIRAVSSQEGGFTLLNAPVATPVAVAQVVLTATPAPVVDNSAVTCTATIQSSSVNLRTGPGTGYTILGYAYRGETYVVGGENPQKNWAVIGLDGGSAWISTANTTLAGNCTQLAVFDIPLKDATPAQITVTTLQPGGNDDNHEGETEHEGGDD